MLECYGKCFILLIVLYYGNEKTGIAGGVQEHRKAIRKMSDHENGRQFQCRIGEYLP